MVRAEYAHYGLRSTSHAIHTAYDVQRTRTNVVITCGGHAREDAYINARTLLPSPPRTHLCPSASSSRSPGRTCAPATTRRDQLAPHQSARRASRPTELSHLVRADLPARRLLDEPRAFRVRPRRARRVLAFQEELPDRHVVRYVRERTAVDLRHCRLCRVPTRETVQRVRVGCSVGEEDGNGGGAEERCLYTRENARRCAARLLGEASDDLGRIRTLLDGHPVRT